jgi:enoyl-CoA hydratase/carnithine racemase
LTSSAPLVTTERRGAVGIVSFNEPEALNPLSTYPGGSEEQLADGIVAFDRDPDVKVIVITGAGRAFSAGADARPARTAAGATSCSEPCRRHPTSTKAGRGRCGTCSSGAASR